jgi:hypothetical protein
MIANDVEVSTEEDVFCEQCGASSEQLTGFLCASCNYEQVERCSGEYDEEDEEEDDDDEYEDDDEDDEDDDVFGYDDDWEEDEEDGEDW